MSRTIIKLNLSADDKSQKALADKELKKAFDAILDRADNGLLDDEDIAFVTARRDYLTDEQLERVTGKTYDELVAEVESGSKASDDLSALKVDDLKAKAEELGIELAGNEKKADLIAKIKEAQA